MWVFRLSHPLFKSSVRAGRTSKTANEPRDEKGRWTRAGIVSKRMPRQGFDGPRGNSLWRCSVPEVAQVLAGRTLEFRGGFPRFGPFVPRIGGIKARVQITYSGDRARDAALGDLELARKLRWVNRHGQPDAARVARYRKAKGLTWHHVERGCDKLELVPTVLHDAARHCGGFSLCT